MKLLAGEETPVTLQAALAWGTQQLKNAASDSPRLDSEVLMQHLLSCSKTFLYCHDNEVLTSSQCRAWQELIARRSLGEPVAYLTGWREFYGRAFQVSPQVLVPRPDTEVLVEVALSLLDQAELAASGRQVLDLCTGSGIVGLTIKLERPAWQVSVQDLSPEALQMAVSNAQQCEGGTVIEHFYGGDLFAEVPHKSGFYLITANPPYVAANAAFGPDCDNNVAAFEPNLALYGGPDGLAIIRRIVAEAPHYLGPGGWLAMEFGVGQEAALAQIFAESAFAPAQFAKDLAGRPRVVFSSLLRRK